MRVPKAVQLPAYAERVIGGLLSIGFSISYIGTAWSGFDSGFDLLPALFGWLVYVLIGVFLFPKTVGMSVTPVGLLTPVAFVIALFRLTFSDSLAVLAIGLAALFTGWLIGKLRPDATGYSSM